MAEKKHNRTGGAPERVVSFADEVVIHTVELARDPSTWYTRAEYYSKIPKILIAVPQRYNTMRR